MVDLYQLVMLYDIAELFFDTAFCFNALVIYFPVYTTSLYLLPNFFLKLMWTNLENTKETPVGMLLIIIQIMLAIRKLILTTR